MKPSQFFIIAASLLLTRLVMAADAPPDRPPGPPPGEESGAPRQTAEEELKEYLTLDKNGDGNLTKDEISSRFQGLITRADADGDGIVSSEELKQMIARRFAAKAKRGGDRGGPPPGGGRPPRPREGSGPP